MVVTKLGINHDKTELVQFLPNVSRLSGTSPTINIGSDLVKVSSQVNNLGIFFDSGMSLASRITTTCKAANYQLYQNQETPDALKTALTY